MKIISRIFAFVDSLGAGKRALVDDTDSILFVKPIESDFFVYCNTDDVTIPTLDALNESGRLKVNLIVGQAGVDANAGNATVKTPRVVIATDQPAFTIKLDSPLAATVGGITVSTSAVLLAAEDSGRKLLLITNNGAGDLYLGKDASVTTSGATMGSVVYPGGCFKVDRHEWRGDIYGIYSQVSASQNVSIFSTTSSE